jgi:hypothetical protein
MKAEKIYNGLMKQSFDDWYKDTLQKYVTRESDYSKEDILDDIKYYFDLENEGS